MKKLVTAILLIVTIGLGFLCYFVVEKTDDNAPVINLLNQALVYNEGADTAALITAVNASDKEDGDVSANIRIEKITPTDSNDQVRVLYAVKDSKNNITKKTFTFGYVPNPDSINGNNGQNALSYNIVLINNLGVENLENSYATILSKK